MMKLENLPEFARYWTIRSLEWSDQFWDEEMGLLRAAHRTDRHTVRDTIWYVTGLLLRGDTARAHRAIESILHYQFDEPGTVYHGTFKRAPQEDHPPEKPEEWKDYDPNWREFICTVFLILMIEFDLPEEVQAKMWVAIEKAAEGAYARAVGAQYTNIALMSAFLLDHAGAKLDQAIWRERAQQLTGEIADLYNLHGTFWEYNSPTYYGVDLYALGLWRKYGLTDAFCSTGADLEAKLWRDIAQFYHAGLKNLCGPYDRSYGMDMTRYLAVVGLHIGLIVPPELAPIPDPAQPFDHANDFYYMPPIALVGTEVPADALPHFQAFQGGRQVTRQVEAGRSATAWLSENLMLGAETEHPSRTPDSQFHAATAHWRLPDGDTGWLRLRCAIPLDATAEPGELRLTFKKAGDIAFEIYPDVTAAGGTWTLPGLQIRCDLPDVQPVIERGEQSVFMRFAVPTGQFRLMFDHQQL